MKMETSKRQRPQVPISNWTQSSWPIEAQDEFESQRDEIAEFSALEKNKSKRFDIRGPSGSVRGYRNIVRSSLERIKVAISGNMERQFGSTNLMSFASCKLNEKSKRTLQLMDHYYRSMYLDKMIADEKDRCVLYTTSLGIIRRTFEDSKSMK